MMSSYDEARRAMVDCQLRTFEITNQTLLTAADAVPRELFVPEDRRPVAYVDQQVRIAAGGADKSARYLLTPMVAARMLQTLDVTPGKTLLDYAGGTGYTAALAASMGLDVTLWEPDEALAAAAKAAFTASGLSVATVTTAPAAKFDAILVNGVCQQKPEKLFTLLKDGGKLVLIEGQGAVTRVMLYQSYGDGVSGRPVFDAAAAVLDEFRTPAAFTF